MSLLIRTPSWLRLLFIMMMTLPPMVVIALTVADQPVLLPRFAIEDIGNVQWLTGTGQIASSIGSYVSVPIETFRNASSIGDNALMSCTSDWGNSAANRLGPQIPACFIFDSLAQRQFNPIDITPLTTTGIRTVGGMAAINIGAATNYVQTGNGMIVRSNGDIWATSSSQRALLYRGYKRQSLIPWFGIETASNASATISVDGDKHTAVFTSNLRGICDMPDKNSFIVLDGSAVRLVDITDVNNILITRLAGSYTSTGAIDGDALTVAGFSQMRACAYSASLNMVYVSELGPLPLRRINLATMMVDRFSAAVIGRADAANYMNAHWAQPSSMVVDDITSTLYINDASAVRMIHLDSGVVETLAGSLDIINGDNDGVAWNARFQARTAISKVYDHLYVLEPSSYRIRSIALPIEILPTNYPQAAVTSGPRWDILPNNVSMIYTVQLSRACAYPIALCITTTGSLVIGLPTDDITSFTYTMTWYYPAGVASLPYAIYHPVVNSVTNATLTIQLSGECVDNGQMAHTTVIRSITINPYALMPSPSRCYTYVGVACTISYVFPTLLLQSSVSPVLITLSDPINNAIQPQMFYFNASTITTGVAIQIALNTAAIVGDNIVQATVTPLNPGDGGIVVQTFPLTITLLPLDIIPDVLPSNTALWTHTIQQTFTLSGPPPGPVTLLGASSLGGVMTSTTLAGASLTGTRTFTAGGMSGNYSVDWFITSAAGARFFASVIPSTWITVVAPVLTLSASLSQLLAVNTTYYLTDWLVSASFPNSAYSLYLNSSGIDYSQPIAAPAKMVFPQGNTAGAGWVRTGSVAGVFSVTFSWIGNIPYPFPTPDAITITIVSSILSVDVTRASLTTASNAMISFTMTPPLRYGIDSDIVVTLSSVDDAFTFSNPYVLTAAVDSSLVTISANFVRKGAAPLGVVYNVVITASGGVPVTPGANVAIHLDSVATIQVTPAAYNMYAPMLGSNYDLIVTLTQPPLLGLRLSFPVTTSDATLVTQTFDFPPYTNTSTTLTIISPTVVSTVVTIQTNIQSTPDQFVYAAQSPVTVTYRKGLYLSQQDYDTLVVNAAMTPQAVGTKHNITFLIAGLPAISQSTTLNFRTVSQLTFTNPSITISSTSPTTVTLEYTIVSRTANANIPVNITLASVGGYDAANYVLTPASIPIYITPMGAITMLVPSAYAVYASNTYMVASLSQPSGGTFYLTGTCATTSITATIYPGDTSALVKFWLIASGQGYLVCVIAWSLAPFGDDLAYQQYTAPTNTALTFQAGMYLYDPLLGANMPTYTRSTVDTQLQVYVGINPAPAAGVTIELIWSVYSSNATANTSTVTISPSPVMHLGNANASYSQHPATIIHLLNTPPGVYQLRCTVTGTGASSYPTDPTHSYYTFATTEVVLQLLTPLVPMMTLVAGSNYGAYLVKISGAPPNGVTTWIDISSPSGAITFTPSSLSWDVAPWNVTQSFTIYVSSALASTINDTIIFKSRDGSIGVSSSLSSISVTLFVPVTNTSSITPAPPVLPFTFISSSINITSYPVTPLVAGTATLLRVTLNATVAASLVATTRTIMVHGNNTDILFKPSSMLTFTGTSLTSQLLQIIPVKHSIGGSSSITFTLTTFDGASSSNAYQPIISDAIAIQPAAQVITSITALTWLVRGSPYIINVTLLNVALPLVTHAVTYTFGTAAAQQVQFIPPSLTWLANDTTAIKQLTILPSITAAIGLFQSITFTPIMSPIVLNQYYLSTADGAVMSAQFRVANKRIVIIGNVPAITTANTLYNISIDVRASAPAQTTDVIMTFVCTPVNKIIFTPSALHIVRTALQTGILEYVTMNQSASVPSSSSVTCSYVLSGISMYDYAPISSTTTVVTAVVVSTAPSVVSSAFNSGGTRVVIVFDMPTNVAGASGTGSYPLSVADCNTVIISSTILGTPIYCQWTDSVTFEIILGPTATIVAGSTITFRSAVIASSQQSSLTWVGGAVTITLPSSFTLPTISLNTPNDIGICSDLVLDARQSTGLPRSFAIYSWNVSSLAPTGSISNLLLISSNGSLITISSSLLQSSASYTFSATVTNFLGATSLSSIKIVNKASIGLPLLTISGASSIMRSSSQPLQLIPSLTFPSCITLSGIWNYNWFITSIIARVGYELLIPLQPSISASSRNLVIAAKSLSAGFDYLFTVNASSSSDIAASVTSSYRVSVLSSSLVAMINGGNRLVSPNSTLVIDASLSFDPDSTSSSSSVSSLSFAWSYSCTTYDGNVCSIGSSISLSSSIIMIDSSDLLPLSVYQFIVIVTSVDGRTSSTSVVIKTDISSISLVKPIIAVTILPSASVMIRNGIFSSDSILRLTASMSVIQGSIIGSIISYNWTETTNGLIDLNKRTSLMNSASFVLPSNTLASGQSYTFRSTVTVTSSSGAVLAISYGEYVIRTSLPPLSSLSQPMTISPSSGMGIALSTIFTISLNGFTGEFDPFTYSFKQLLSDGSEIMIGDAFVLSSSFISIRLPAGTITIVGYVINAAGQSTRVTSTVTVMSSTIISSLPPFDDTISTNNIRTIIIINYIMNITSTLLRDQTLIGDSSNALQTIQGLTDLLNNNVIITSSTSNETLANINDIRQQFLQIIVISSLTSTPEQVAVTLQLLTQFELGNNSVILTLDVAQELLKRLLSINSGNIDPSGVITVTNGTQISLVGIISNVIGSTNNCSNIARVSSSLTSVLNVALSDTIADENPLTIPSSNVIVSGSRTSSDNHVTPTILILGGSNVQISPEATSDDDGDNNDYNDIHVIQYAPSSVILSCYANTTNSTSAILVDNIINGNTTNGGLPSDVPISPITSIEIHNSNGTTISIKNLTQPILFNPLLSESIVSIFTLGARSCSLPQPVCSWFDPSTKSWSTSGCTTSYITGSSSVQCSCNHLTEFAILARDAATCGIVTYDDEKKVYGVFAILYAIIAAVSLTQLLRVLIYTRKKCKFDLLSAEHVCVFVIAIIRGILCLIRGQFAWSGIELQSMSFVAIGLLTAVPYLFQFLAYTFLVATWASVYHFAMENRGASPFARLKVPFIIVNSIIGIVVFGIFGAIGGVNDADAANKLSITGTIIMAILTWIMVAVYLIYGRGLILTLSKTGGGTAAKSPVVRNLYYATAAFCFCFGLEAIIWVISAVVLNNLHDDAAGILAAYYAVNWCSLVIILLMFRNGVNKLSPSHGKSQDGQSSNTQRTHSTGKKNAPAPLKKASSEMASPLSQSTRPLRAPSSMTLSDDDGAGESPPLQPAHHSNSHHDVPAVELV